MKKLLIAAAGLAVLALLAQGLANAQEASAGTGDRKFDAQLTKLRNEAKADPEGFLRRLSERHNIPEQEIREAKDKNGLDEADTYMATALARRTNRRVGDVAAEYKQNKGQGWGVMAQRMGIKPGSPEFKQMKADAKGHTSHMKAMAKNKKKLHDQEMARQKAKARKDMGEDDDRGPAKGKGQGKNKKK